jgi:hypothetical protein
MGSPRVLRRDQLIACQLFHTQTASNELRPTKFGKLTPVEKIWDRKFKRKLKAGV